MSKIEKQLKKGVRLYNVLEEMAMNQIWKHQVSVYKKDEMIHAAIKTLNNLKSNNYFLHVNIAMKSVIKPKQR